MKKHLLPVTEYQEPVDFANKQLEIFWLPEEIKVEKDIQDVLTNFSESEKHAVITTLKLFSLYETHAGDEYWGSRFKGMFDGAEFHRMASVFSMFELAVHAPFYNKINELLNLDTPEFYMSYTENEVLSDRIKFVGDMINHPNDLVSLAAFSMVEGAILYSSFAFLKHYQSQGKNKLVNVIRGINFSVRDESIHHLAGAWCFKLKKQKANLSQEQEIELEQTIREIAITILEHEKEINTLTFSKGKIEGITQHQCDNFSASRLDECLSHLGYAKEFNTEYNPIKEWFYKGINDYQFNDFFSGQGREYNRNWDESEFVWKGKDD